jgi:hypothetical protein
MASSLYNTIKYIYVHQNRPKIGQEMSANCFVLCVIIILCPRSFILETLMSPGWVVKTISKLLLLPAGTKQLFSLYSALTEIIKWTINKNLLSLYYSLSLYSPFPFNNNKAHVLDRGTRP